MKNVTFFENLATDIQNSAKGLNKQDWANLTRSQRIIYFKNRNIKKLAPLAKANKMSVGEILWLNFSKGEDALLKLKGFGRAYAEYASYIVGERPKVVVTRHPALVDLLVEKGVVEPDTCVRTHVSEQDVIGKDVIGVLPMHLASKANSITECSLNIPKELRGVELSLSQLRECFSEIRAYKVDLI